jgi:hypothetical protein
MVYFCLARFSQLHTVSGPVLLLPVHVWPGTLLPLPIIALVAGSNSRGQYGMWGGLLHVLWLGGGL